MAQYPQAHITVELVSTRNEAYEAGHDPSLSEMDVMGTDYFEARIRDMFRLNGLDYLDVKATHRLIGTKENAA